jgi:hypothetical protein
MENITITGALKHFAGGYIVLTSFQTTPWIKYYPHEGKGNYYQQYLKTS